MGFTPSTTNKQVCKQILPPGLTRALLDLGCFITERESGVDCSGLWTGASRTQSGRSGGGD